MKLSDLVARRWTQRVVGVLSAMAVTAAVAGCGGAGGAAAGATSSPSDKVVPVRVRVGPQGGVVVVAPVFIDGRGPFRFIVDTGASRSVIDQTLARRLGFAIQPAHQALTGVNATHSAGRITVSRWRIGGVALPAEPALTLPLAADRRGPGLGDLIGSDNLSQFGSFELDYPAGRLILGAR